MKCKTWGHEIEKSQKLKSKIMKDIGLEVTYPIKHTETYDEIKIPNGWRLPELWELFRIAQYDLKFLKEDRWVVYYSLPTYYAKENGYTSGLYVDSYCGLYSECDNVADSVGDGRVVFVKEKGK